MSRQLTEDNLFVTNSQGKEVRFDLQLMEDKSGHQIAIASERPDSQAPLWTAREEVGQDLKAIDGVRLNDLTYCERAGRNQGAEAVTFQEAPHLGPDRVQVSGRVQHLSEQNYRAMLETATRGVATPDQGAEQQREQLQQMRETALPQTDIERER